MQWVEIKGICQQYNYCGQRFAEFAEMMVALGLPVCDPVNKQYVKTNKQLELFNE